MAQSFARVFPPWRMPNIAATSCARLKSTSDEELRDLIANLGGHDLPKLIEVFNQADAVEDAPAVVFAYTVKGFGLPMAGDPLNHSQLLNQSQMDALQETLGDGIEDVWAGLPEGSPAWELARRSADRLRERHEDRYTVRSGQTCRQRSMPGIPKRLRLRNRWAVRWRGWPISMPCAIGW